MVSHDRYFLDRNVDFLATFENGSVSTRYPAPYSTYQRMRQELLAEKLKAGLIEQPDRFTEEQPKAGSSPAVHSHPRSRTLTWKEARELDTLESEIGRLEAKKEQIEGAINDAGGDYELLQELSGKLISLEEELEKDVERWMELSEISG